MRLLLTLMLACIVHAQEWERGVPQLTGIIGPNLEDGRNGAQPTLGIGLDLGLARNVAATGNYSWNRIGAASATGWIVDRKYDLESVAAYHDLLAGVRVHTNGRFAPFAALLGGVTVATVRVSVNQTDTRGRHAEPAVGAQGGFEVHLGRGIYLRSMAQAVRPTNMYWHGHVGIGFSYRTSGRAEPSWAGR